MRSAPMPFVTGSPGRRLALLALACLVAACQPSPEEQRARAEQATASGDLREAVIHLKAYVQQRPNDGEARATLGRVQFTLGDAAGAEKEFRRALALGQPPAALKPALVEALLAQGRFAEALAELGDVADGADSDHRLLLLAGRALRGAGRFDEAQVRFRAALARAPDDTDAVVSLAELLVAMGRQAEADPLIDRALELDPKYVPAIVLQGRRIADRDGAGPAAAYFTSHLDVARTLRDRTDLLVQLADAQLSAEDRAGAARTLTELQRIAPGEVPTRFLRAWLKAQEGDFTTAMLALQRLLIDAPDFLPAERLLGTVQYLDGNIEQAAVHIARILAEGPPDMFLARLLAEIRLQQNRPDQALQTLLPMMRQGPGAVFDQRILVLAGQASLRLGDAPAAVEYFRRSSAGDPDDERLRLGEISALLAAGDVGSARTMLQGMRASTSSKAAVDYLTVVAHLVERDYPTAQQLAGRLAGEHAEAPWAHLLLASVYLVQGQMEAARGPLRAVLALEPANKEALLNLARIDVQSGDYESGIGALRRLIATEPADLRPRLLLARTEMEAGRTEQALTEARLAVRGAPDSVPALNLLGTVAAGAGYWDEARANFGRATELDPRNPRSWLNLAGAVVRGGQRSGVPDGLERALALAPDDPQVLAAAADLLVEMGRPAEAVPIAARAYAAAPGAETAMRACRAGNAANRPQSCGLLDEWIQRHPGDVPARLFRASVYQARSNRAAAMAQYEAVIGYHPGEPVALNNLAWLYFEADDQRALETARRALAAQPQSLPAMDTLGWIEVNQGNQRRGLELLTAAAAGSPQDPDVGYHLAFALAATGDVRGARTAVSRVLASEEPFANRAAAEDLDRRLQGVLAGGDG